MEEPGSWAITSGERPPSWMTRPDPFDVAAALAAAHRAEQRALEIDGLREARTQRAQATLGQWRGPKRADFEAGFAQLQRDARAAAAGLRSDAEELRRRAARAQGREHARLDALRRWRAQTTVDLGPQPI